MKGAETMPNPYVNEEYSTERVKSSPSKEDLIIARQPIDITPTIMPCKKRINNNLSIEKQEAAPKLVNIKTIKAKIMLRRCPTLSNIAPKKIHPIAKPKIETVTAFCAFCIDVSKLVAIEGSVGTNKLIEIPERKLSKEINIMSL